MSVAPDRFEIDGITLHLDDEGGSGEGGSGEGGSGEGGSGFAVLFQHGLGGDARQTAEAFPLDPAWRRLTLECRGHGSSDAGDPGDFSIARYTDDVAALIEARARPPLVVGGISMGAAIALRLAVCRPELVRGLILVRLAWVTGAAPDNMAPNDEVGRLLQRLPVEAARQAFLSSETAARLAEQAPDNLASLCGFFDRPNPAILATLLRRIAADGPGVTERQVASIAAPTLIVATACDIVHPLAHAEALAALIPAARLRTVTSKACDRARHISELHDALRLFLKDFP